MFSTELQILPPQSLPPPTPYFPSLCKAVSGNPHGIHEGEQALQLGRLKLLTLVSHI